MPQLLTENDLPVSYEISINGEVLSGELEVISIGVVLEINRIATATLKISDGGVFGLENEPFANSDSDYFVPGNEIKISLGYGDERSVAFKGVIVGQRMIARSNTSFLLVTCKDKSFKLTRSRANTIMADSADDAMFSSLLSEAGLTASVDSTKQFAYPLFQFNSSDWDYLMIRAEAGNFFVLTDQNEVSVKSFDFSSSPDFTIDGGMSSIEVDLELSGENTYADFNFTSWNPRTQEASKVSASMSDPLTLGNLSAQKIAESLHIPALNKFTSAAVSSEELTDFSKSWINKSVLSKIQGKITIPGTVSVKPGTLVELKNIGSRFDGNAFVSKTEQRCVDGGWVTTVYVGMQSRWHSSLPDVQEEDGLGLLPGARGTHLGKVKQIDEDPESEYRVLIELGAFQNSSNSNTIWARMAFNYASNQAGFFFFPEIDDEVLVTFVNGDPRFPVIIGSLYSSGLAPKLVPDKENSTKAIHSKTGIALLFNEKDKILTIQTPGGNKMILDDKGGQVSIADSNSNSAILSKDGIQLSSAKDIVLDAKGNINLKAVSGISLEASGGDLTGKGLNVTLQAQMSLKAAGTASAEFSASGQTTLKGAMVMIN